MKQLKSFRVLALVILAISFFGCMTSGSKSTPPPPPGPTPTPTPGAAHNVDLGWTSSGPSATGYNVYRSSQSGGPYRALTSSPLTNPTYTDSTALAGQTYFYVVTVLDADGLESPFSKEVTVTVPSP